MLNVICIKIIKSKKENCKKREEYIMKHGMVVNGNWNTFLTLAGEKLLLVQRRHSFVIFLPIVFTIFVLAVLLLTAFLVFISFFHSLSLFIIVSLLLVSACMSMIAKVIIDWYFHVYILTTRKILEVWYTPLTSYNVNDVLLDKVNCTEIDIKINGFIHELIGMGDIVVTFDRPTHQEEFVFNDIPQPETIEKFLTQRLMDHGADAPLFPMWFRERHGFAKN